MKLPIKRIYNEFDESELRGSVSSTCQMRTVDMPKRDPSTCCDAGGFKVDIATYCAGCLIFPGFVFGMLELGPVP